MVCLLGSDDFQQLSLLYAVLTTQVRSQSGRTERFSEVEKWHIKNRLKGGIIACH